MSPVHRPADHVGGDRCGGELEAVIFDRLGDRDVLVATKEGLLVVLAPAAGRVSPPADADTDLGRLMHGELNRLRHGRPWRVAVGRAHPGLYGIARSYEEAREALTMAGRLHLDAPIVTAHDLLVYRVLLRDQPAIVDLVSAVLSPLLQARGGAEPLLLPWTPTSAPARWPPNPPSGCTCPCVPSPIDWPASKH